MFLKTSDLGDYSNIEQVYSNLLTWLDYSFLKINGYQNISSSFSGAYSENPSILKHVVDPNYTSGTVWQSLNKPWVWEASAVPAATIADRVIVDNTTYVTASTTGAFAHKINYRDGRVIFDSPISTTSVVKCPHSYKLVNFDIVENVNFLKILNSRVHDVDTVDSINNSINTLRLPLVAIDVIGLNKTGYAQGGLTLRHNYVVVFYIIAKSKIFASKIADILSAEVVNSIKMYNAASYNTNFQGSGLLISSPLTYPSLVNAYSFGTLYFEDNPSGIGSKQITPNLYMIQVKNNAFLIR